jgi:hypothetical protein
MDEDEFNLALLVDRPLFSTVHNTCANCQSDNIVDTDEDEGLLFVTCFDCGFQWTEEAEGGE